MEEQLPLKLYYVAENRFGGPIEVKVFKHQMPAGILQMAGPFGLPLSVKAVYRLRTRQFLVTGTCYEEIGVAPNEVLIATDSSDSEMLQGLADCYNWQAAPPPSQNRRRSVFISYSHADQGWLDRVKVHLKPLERDHTIDVWSDRMIQSGQNWREEIAAAVDNARVALLLISADFLASDFIVNNELPPLLAKAANESAVILPLILKPSRFLREETLSCYQPVNDPRRPLLGLSEAGREAILVKLSEDIERIVQT